MEERRSDSWNQASLPIWTALPPDDTVFASPSEDENQESSQEMHDELTDSPAPKALKRKPISLRSPLPRNATAVNAYKRPRISSDVNGADSGRRSRYMSDNDDVPASAHAKPTRKPSTPSNPNRRSSLPSNKLASAISDFQKTHGPMPPSLHTKTKNPASSSAVKDKPTSRNIMCRTLGSKASKSENPLQSTSDIRPKPLLKEQAKRKTTPTNVAAIDLTNSDDDTSAYIPFGKFDNPIVLDDSDEEEQTAVHMQGSAPPMSHDAKDDPSAHTAIDSPIRISSGSAAVHRDDSPPFLEHPSGTPGLSSSEGTGDELALIRDASSTAHTDVDLLDPAMDVDSSQPLAACPSHFDPSIPSLSLSTLTHTSLAKHVTPPAQQPSTSSAQATPVAKPPQTSVSPQRRIRIENTLLSGPTGFFKYVHQRRASASGRVGSQISTGGSTPQVVQGPADSPVSSVPEERASDGYASTSAAELPPSSEVSRAGSVEPPSRPASTTSLPLAQIKQEVPARPASQGPPPTMASPSTGAEGRNSVLENTISTARIALAQQQNAYIDLTLSDSDDDARPTTWSDPDDIAHTTKLLANIAPAIFADRPATPPQLSARAPTSKPPPLFNVIQAAKRYSQRASESTSSGSDSFPVSRRTSIDIPVVGKDRGAVIPSSSSSDDPLARSRDRSRRPTSSPDDMEVDEEDSPPIGRKRGRPRKKPVASPPVSEGGPGVRRGGRSGKQRAQSPLASGSEYDEKGEHTSDAEVHDILLGEKERSDSPGTSTEKRQYFLRDRKPVVKKPVLPPPPTRGRGRGKRPQVARSGPTEQALVPAMTQMEIYSDDDDDDSDPNVLTWKKNGQALYLEYADVYLRARDLSFNLSDRMMRLPIEFRRAEQMQLATLKSEILVASGEDEPDAPPITITNEVDGEQCPPLEFHYTNKMYHGEGVPRPDLDHLDHCNCVGRCKPETCPCAQKQVKWMNLELWGTKQPFPPPTFIYDDAGKIKPIYYDNHPIFECNAKCRCDDEWCPNRVVQKGRKVRVNIKKTQNKGWGIFAGQDIPAHTFIGIYAGEFLTAQEGDERGEKYEEFGRTYLFNIDGHHISRWQQHNGLKEETKYCIDAYHAGNFTRYLNHSCNPNCGIVPCYINEADIEKGMLTIFTSRNVSEGEELCFSYFGEPDERDRRPMSKKERDKLIKIHSLCQCGAPKCTGRMWKYQSDEESTTDAED